MSLGINIYKVYIPLSKNDLRLLKIKHQTEYITPYFITLLIAQNISWANPVLKHNMSSEKKHTFRT